MRKRIASILLAAIMLIGCSAVACAAYIPEPEIAPQASWYLDSYSVTLSALGDGEMYIDMTVLGTDVMTRIGVNKILIEEKIDGEWSEFDTLYGGNNPNFYQYNTIMYLGESGFTGVPGRDYRVTLTVYAGNSSGSDTGEITSVIKTCY